jgi:putative phosphoribosyl transferase
VPLIEARSPGDIYRIVPMLFADRSAAGRVLAKSLHGYSGRKPVILALPRGGVPVAFPIAEAFKAPLDIVLVRKIGAPFQPELALGAVVDGEKPEVVINEDIRDALELPESYINEAIGVQLKEIERRRKAYVGDRQPVPVAGRVAILVDDGIATGATMLAAVRATRRHDPAEIVVATPVASADTIVRLEAEADVVICPHPIAYMGGVGQFYGDFSQVAEATVSALLEKAAS